MWAASIGRIRIKRFQFRRSNSEFIEGVVFREDGQLSIPKVQFRAASVPGSGRSVPAFNSEGPIHSCRSWPGRSPFDLLSIPKVQFRGCAAAAVRSCPPPFNSEGPIQSQPFTLYAVDDDNFQFRRSNSEFFVAVAHFTKTTFNSEGPIQRYRR